MCCGLRSSVVSDSVTPWTVAHQSPLSIELSRQDYQSGVTLPTPGDLPDQGTEPVSLASPAFQKDSLSLVHLGSPTSFHEQPQIIKHVRPCLQKTGWSSSLPFLPPHVLPSYQVTSAGRHTTWTLLLCIPFKYLLRPDLMEV